MAVPRYRYNLYWNDHKTLIASAVQNLNSCPDVTLVCGKTEIHANKVVLSACSPFFHSLLKDHTDSWTIISMADMNPDHIHSLFSFINSGEMTTTQDDLDQLFDIAKQLELKCLTVKDSIKTVKVPVDWSNIDKDFDFNPRLNNSLVSNCSKKLSKKPVREVASSYEEVQMWDKESYKLKLTDMLENSKQFREDGKTCWLCGMCGVLIRDRRSALRHMESHLHVRVKCQECPKSFKTLEGLTRHICVANKTRRESFSVALGVTLPFAAKQVNVGEQVNAVKTVENVGVVGAAKDVEGDVKTSIVKRIALSDVAYGADDLIVGQNNEKNLNENVTEVDQPCASEVSFCEVYGVELIHYTAESLTDSQLNGSNLKSNPDSDVQPENSSTVHLEDHITIYPEDYSTVGPGDHPTLSPEDDTPIGSLASPTVEGFNNNTCIEVDDILVDSTGKTGASGFHENKKMLMAKVDTDWYCLICGKFWPGMSMCRRHIESHLSEAKM